MSAPIYSLSGYSYHQFHLLCSGLVLVMMHKTLWCSLPFAKGSETETSLWNKTEKKPKKPGVCLKVAQVKEPVVSGGGKEWVRMASGPLAIEAMLILASGISNWHFLKC